LSFDDHVPRGGQTIEYNKRNGGAASPYVFDAESTGMAIAAACMPDLLLLIAHTIKCYADC
jgi:hypothetical protein